MTLVVQAIEQPDVSIWIVIKDRESSIAKTKARPGEVRLRDDAQDGVHHPVEDATM